MERKDYYADVDISLLKKPEGTPMYLVYMNRMCTNVDIEEVKYVGFNRRWKQEHYDETQPRCSVDYEQEYFDIMFEEEPGMDYLTISEAWHGWTGLRGYDTDEHEAVGVLRGDFTDAYFTTSVDALNRYLEKKNIPEKIDEQESKIKKVKRALSKFFGQKTDRTPETCSLDIYEMVPVVHYKEKWGMNFVELDEPAPEKEEKLVKTFPLKLMNAHAGEMFNYKERFYEPDRWVRDFTFDVEISDELRKFLTKAKNENTAANSIYLDLLDNKHITTDLEQELQFFAEHWLPKEGNIKSFRYAGNGTFADEYPMTKTDHYVVKLKINK